MLFFCLVFKTVLFDRSVASRGLSACLQFICCRGAGGVAIVVAVLSYLSVVELLGR